MSLSKYTIRRLKIEIINMSKLGHDSHNDVTTFEYNEMVHTITVCNGGQFCQKKVTLGTYMFVTSLIYVDPRILRQYSIKMDDKVELFSTFLSFI